MVHYTYNYMESSVRQLYLEAHAQSQVGYIRTATTHATTVLAAGLGATITRQYLILLGVNETWQGSMYST